MFKLNLKNLIRKKSVPALLTFIIQATLSTTNAYAIDYVDTRPCDNNKEKNIFTAEEFNQKFSFRKINNILNQNSEILSIKTAMAQVDHEVQCYRLNYNIEKSDEISQLKKANIEVEEPGEDSEYFMLQYQLTRAESFSYIFKPLLVLNDKQLTDKDSMANACKQIKARFLTFLYEFTTIRTAGVKTNQSSQSANNELGEDDIMVGSHLKSLRSKFIEINKPLLKNICPDLDLEKAAGESRKK